MRYILLGLVLGFIVNFFIVLHKGGVAIVPAFNVKIENINTGLTRNTNVDQSIETFGVKSGKDIFCINANGELVGHSGFPHLASVSSNGKFFVQFEKVGREIEYFNISGERFWRMRSLEYPYVSAAGRLILLKIGDHSSIRISDFNGNVFSENDIQGKFSTVISFSERNDFGAVGFFCGNYYFVSDTGGVIHSGRSPQGMMVKSIAISSNGKYGAVHSGDVANDIVTLVNFERGTSRGIRLQNVHKTRIPLHVNDNGEITLVESDYIVRYRQNTKPLFQIRINERRDGQHSITTGNGFTSITFMSKNGGVENIVFTDSGNVLVYKTYPTETFLVSYPSQSSILLRGSENLFGYRLDGL